MPPQSSDGPGSAAVRVAWIVSRHLLMGQAVATAMARHSIGTRAVTLDTVLDVLADVDQDGDVVFVIDDQRSVSALVLIGELAARAPAPIVVMTERPDDPHWRALLSEGGVTEVVPSTKPLDDVVQLLMRVRTAQPILADDE